MNRFLSAAFAILFFASTSFAAPGVPQGTSQRSEVPDATIAPTTINGQCATPATGCATGQWVRTKIGGRQTIGGTVTPAVFTGTLACYFTKDGVNWAQGMIRITTGNEFTAGPYAPTSGFTASSTITFYTCLSMLGGVTDVAVVSTAAVTNTATVNLVATNTIPRMADSLYSTKGLQSNNGMYAPVQEPHNAGRTFVVLGADGVTPAIADTVITFSKNAAGTVTGGLTTYPITSGRTFRLQSVCGSFTAGAAANTARVRVRLNTGGACIAGSGLLLPALELTPQYGTAAASEGWAAGCVTVPDGLEMTGASWNICLSESAVAASGTLTVNLIGYEY